MNRSRFFAPRSPFRECARCHRKLQRAAFPPSKTVQDRLSSWCRECHVTVTRQWRAEHRDELKVARRAAYAANRAEIAEQRRAWYAKSRDAINARRRAAYATRRSAA